MRDGKLVLGRPPVDAGDEELEVWVEAFLDAILGPEPSTMTGSITENPEGDEESPLSLDRRFQSSGRS